MQFDQRPMGIWVCTETYDVMRDVLQPKLKKYLDLDRIIDEAFVKKDCWSYIKYKAADGTISEITFKSYDQGRKRFQGAGKQFIWFDEEPPRDIWEECTVREEAGRELRIVLTMTPVQGMTWVYEELYLATGNPDIKVLTASWDDNPWLPQEQKDRMARGLTPEALKVRREGKFVRMTGLVCPWFDRGVHVQDLIFDPAWTIYRVIDFGFSQPTCVIWIGVDYDNNWHIYDGIYQTGLTTPQLKEAMIRKDGKRFITNCWADSAQASDIQQLNDLGVSVLPVEKISGDSKESWDEYRARLLMEQGKFAQGGRPKIILGSNLTRFDEKLGREVNWAVAEIEKLKWAEKTVEEQITQKPRWGDQAKHFIDVLSYFAHEHRREFEPIEPSRTRTDRPVYYQPVGAMFDEKHDPYDQG